MHRILLLSSFPHLDAASEMKALALTTLLEAAGARVTRLDVDGTVPHLASYWGDSNARSDGGVLVVPDGKVGAELCTRLRPQLVDAPRHFPLWITGASTHAALLQDYLSGAARSLYICPGVAGVDVGHILEFLKLVYLLSPYRNRSNGA